MTHPAQNGKVEFTHLDSSDEEYSWLDVNGHVNETEWLPEGDWILSISQT